MSETESVEVHHYPARHPLENKVLCAAERGSSREWVFEVAEYDDYAVARLICTYSFGELDEDTVEPQDDNVHVPWPVARAVSLRDDVDAVKNPVDGIPDEAEQRSLFERFVRPIRDDS